MFGIRDARTASRGALLAWCVLCIPMASLSSHAQAATYANLEVVKPIKTCADLTQAKLSEAVGAAVTIGSASQIQTGKGPFCKVIGNIAPTIGFEVDLPIDHWTQRYFQGGCGGLCGMRGAQMSNAGSCVPALDGEFVVAGDDMGHSGAIQDAEFGRDPQKRIDFAYRANHVTALAAKALIKAFYGQAPRYSYFVGCSDGGREALMEAQRFPKDFDGVSAGDPAALFQLQNSFFHAWNVLADKRADGTNILLPAKQRLIHHAVVGQCDTLSGVKDGLMQDPRTCKFDPASIKCSAGATDTGKCLTAEEVAVMHKLYEGAKDDKGRVVTFGVQRGSEDQLLIAQTPTGSSMSAGMVAASMQYVILPEVSAADADVDKFAFTAANFDRVMQLAPLYDATNTNLKAFAARSGKLILWHGWSDTGITPGVSIAYFQGVQKFMGVAETDKFMRLFLIPGMGHCGGGDGYDQVDLLTPLMVWTEAGEAPAMLLTGKPAQRRMMMGPPPSGGTGGPAGGPLPPGPLPSPMPKLLATRPVYPYPYIPRYTGKGDPNDATNYIEVKSPAVLPQVFDKSVDSMIGPNNQKNYGVKDGKLVVLN